MENGRIYYLGPVGTHSHEAAWQFATRLCMDSFPLIPESSIAQVIDRISRNPGLANGFACVPLENSIQGSVTMTWDRLFRFLHTGKGARISDAQMRFSDPFGWHGFGIRAVLTLPIAHHLLSAGPLQCESVTHVYSHPQALAQCKVWIETNLPQAVQMTVSSTAEAARLVQDSTDVSKVAIGSARAGKEYGLHTTASPIQDFDYNYTRFGLLSNVPLSFSQADINRYMTSICLAGVQNQPGGLLKALSPFYQNGLNLTRIESRPVGHELGTYVFYLDVETDKTRLGDEWKRAWEIVLNTLVGEGIDVVRLGAYPILE